MKFQKKPVTIEAVQFTGDNFERITNFMGRIFDPASQEIPTLEGNLKADVGDWIIKGVKGEFYPCKPDIFAMTYDPVL